MTKFITSAFALTFVAFVGFGSAANAQSMTTPNLSYPEANSGWGCKFSGTCATATVATSGVKK